ncbi:MAG: phenylacetate--CoA ligase family protein, partial [Burkholderiales bacterium]|nr:phenylacetate--CoA ligase family protein [Burkholderiales bacterium]
AMTLHCEIRDEKPGETSTAAIVASIREVTKLRGEVAFVATGSLANDGKVIDDVRKYE